MGQGYLDKLLELTIKELPEYKHTKIKATIARGLHEMEIGEKACHLSIFKSNKRKLFTEFSLSYMMSPNLQVIISKKLANSLGLGNDTSVEELFTKHQLKTIRLPERSYTNKVDKIFEQHPALIYSRPTISESGLYAMLKTRRTDFLIASPSIANYVLADAAIQYKSLTIKGMEKYGIAYIGCSKTPWGKSVIRKINTVLLKIRSTEPYFRAMTMWLSEDDINHDYMQFYQTQFLSN
jgi:uncharacterized protein (TIGR02285 family)